MTNAQQRVVSAARDRPAISEADLELIDEIADALWVRMCDDLRQILAEKVAARVMEACREKHRDHLEPQ